MDFRVVVLVVLVVGSTSGWTTVVQEVREVRDAAMARAIRVRIRLLF